jgi:hypothetical protein
MKGDFAMAGVEELKQIQASHEPELFAKAGVHAVGIGYKTVAGKQTDELAIVVLVERKLSSDSIDAANLIPASLDGVPTDVVERGRAELAAATSAISIDESERRPLVGGCAIAANPPPPGEPTGYAGTLGGFADWTDELGLTWPVGVSASHVLGPVDSNSKGSKVMQPPRGPQVSQVSMSVRNPDAGVDAGGFAGSVKGVDCSNTILNIGTLAGSYHLQQSDLNKQVQKSGAASKVTTGNISLINVTVPLEGGARYVEQIFISGAFCEPGDSGSFVVMPSASVAGAYSVVGVLMAQERGAGATGGYANSIEHVEAALGLRFPASLG